MSITLGSVPLHDYSTPYHYTYDNLPLTALVANDNILKTAIDVLNAGPPNLPFSIAPPVSGVAYGNTLAYPISVVVSGGTVSAITFSRDNATYYTVGSTSGMILLSPGDYIKIVYTVVPTMVGIPR